MVSQDPCDSMMNVLMEKIVDLRRKDTSVVEYANEFDDLSMYAPLMVATMEAKSAKFIKGTNFRISIRFVVNEKEHMEHSLDLALKWEQ